MIAYTLNKDNSINILGGSPSLDTLHKILPDKEFDVFDGEPFEFNGKYYLSEADVSEAEKEAKAEADEEQRVQSLQPTVEEQVTEISESLLALTLAQEETITQLTEQNEALHAQLSEVSEALVGLMFGE